MAKSKGGNSRRRGNQMRGNQDKRTKYNKERASDRENEQNAPKGRLDPLNDLSWYNRNPILLQATANLPFPYRPGMNVPLGVYTNTNVSPVQSSVVKYAVPGAMVINWIPTVGWSDSATSPASIVARELYGKVREAFSGTLSVDAPDLVIYLVALDSVFSYIGALKRVYRIINTYSPNNYVVPDTLLSAMGLSNNLILDIKGNRTKFWGQINELIAMTRKFKCPAVFDYFNRHYWLNDNVYIDQPMASGQFIAFVQKQYYKFALLDTPDKVQAGGCELTDSALGTASVTDLLFAFGRSLIDALASSEDAYTISGYLARAFEGQPQFIVDDLQQDEMFEPVYVPEVLPQIENARSYNPTLSGGATLTGNNIIQDPNKNSIICMPTLNLPVTTALNKTYHNMENWVLNPMLNIRSQAPSAAEITIASRMCNACRYLGTTASKSLFQIMCASEIVSSIVVTFNTSSTTPIPQHLVLTNGTSMNLNTIQSLIMLSNYDWHPMVQIFGSTDTEMHDVLDYGNILGDVTNLTTISLQNLENLHRVCLYSEFNSFGVL